MILAFAVSVQIFLPNNRLKVFDYTQKNRSKV